MKAYYDFLTLFTNFQEKLTGRKKISKDILMSPNEHIYQLPKWMYKPSRSVIAPP